MKGWRARLGFLIPPGNPTVEPEMIAMAPPGVSVHFSRMVAGGAAGTHHGQEERNRSQIEHIDESAALLAMVKPNVMMLAHTATSYTLGRGAEADLLQHLQSQYAIPVATAFGSVAAALNALGVKRLALGTPYSEEITLKGKAHLEECGFEVVSHEPPRECYRHLRRDGRARLPAGPLRGQTRSPGGFSERHRHADHRDSGGTGAGPRQASAFRRFGNDVACVATWLACGTPYPATVGFLHQ